MSNIMGIINVDKRGKHIPGCNLPYVSYFIKKLELSRNITNNPFQVREDDKWLIMCDDICLFHLKNKKNLINWLEHNLNSLYIFIDEEISGTEQLSFDWLESWEQVHNWIIFDKIEGGYNFGIQKWVKN